MRRTPRLKDHHSFGIAALLVRPAASAVNSDSENVHRMPNPVRGNSNANGHESTRRKTEFSPQTQEYTRAFDFQIGLYSRLFVSIAVGFFLKLLFQLEVKESADRVGGLRIVSDEVISKRWRRIKNVVYPKRNFAAG